MDVPDLTKLEKAIRDTIGGLNKVEEGNEHPYSDWKNTIPNPNDYDLQPERL